MTHERLPSWRPPAPLPGPRRTKRTILRWLLTSDAAALLAAIDENRSAYLPWLPWVRTENRDEAETIYSIESFRRKRERTDPPADDFLLGIFDAADGTLLGGTGLHRLELATATAEIGYWIRPSRRGQGLCTEAVRALIDWGFEDQPTGWGLRRIHITCASGNHASRRVPEKLGLRLESQRCGERWIDGLGWSDFLGWGVLADEWRRAKP